jgi:uncharacterized metal-binding protein YceD (DUF177 family)
MRFKIKDIGDESLAVHLPVTATWLAAECPDLEARPAAGGLALRGVLERSGDDFLLRGDLRGGLESTCARCLEPARVMFDVPLAVTFVEKSPGSGDDDDDDDDGDVVFFDSDEIDLGAELRDELLLAMPLSPLCQEGCRGLCAVCGGNRNLTPCDCEESQRQATTKLSALGKIKL